MKPKSSTNVTRKDKVEKHSGEGAEHNSDIDLSDLEK